MYKQKALSLGVICLGVLFAVSTYGQSKTSGNVKTKDASDEKPIQDARQKGDGGDTQCDFSSYSTIKATPVIKRQVKPAYPKAARRQKIGGKVLIKLLVNREGKVEQVCAVKGHNLLIPSALAAARLWEFSANDIQKNLERLKRDYFETVVTFQVAP